MAFLRVETSMMDSLITKAVFPLRGQLTYDAWAMNAKDAARWSDLLYYPGDPFPDDAFPYLAYNLGGCKRAVIIFHSETCYATEAVNEFKPHISEDCALFFPEYPGYFGDDQTPSADLICRQAVLMFLIVMRTTGLPESDITIVGQSIGTGPAIYAAARLCCEPPSLRNLVLISPIVSVQDTARRILEQWYCGFVSGLFPKFFDNENEIRGVTCPVYILSRKHDPNTSLDGIAALHTACPSRDIQHIEIPTGRNMLVVIEDLMKG